MRNDKRKKGFKAKSNYLSDELIDEVTKSNRTKLLRMCDIFLFGDEGEKGGIESWDHLSIFAGILN
jgi:hypothetical protein